MYKQFIVIVTMPQDSVCYSNVSQKWLKIVWFYFTVSNMFNKKLSWVPWGKIVMVWYYYCAYFSIAANWFNLLHELYPLGLSKHVNRPMYLRIKKNGTSPVGMFIGRSYCINQKFIFKSIDSTLCWHFNQMVR